MAIGKVLCYTASDNLDEEIMISTTRRLYSEKKSFGYYDFLSKHLSDT